MRLANDDATTGDSPMPWRIESPSGLAIAVNRNGSLRRIDFGSVAVSLFPGNEVEGGPANLYLRLHGETIRLAPLLGPGSPSAFSLEGGTLCATGRWESIRYRLVLALAESAPAWFWHVELENEGAAALTADLVYAQDLALAPYAAVRLNEHYVSHYVDHSPLAHPDRGWMVASRQNLAAEGRHPWSLVGSLGHGAAFATDALDIHGFAARSGEAPAGVARGLGDSRLQHEHSMVAIRDAAATLAPGERAACGFLGWVEADHAAASGGADLAIAARACGLPEAAAPATAVRAAGRPPASTLFAPALLLEPLDLAADELDRFFGADRVHEEVEDGRLLSFFTGQGAHVALRAKELAVLRPHGHILRTGGALAPDETGLASTAWMGGVFHSMVTQGHVSINRFLSTARSYLGLFRSHGQRVFIERDGQWTLLALASAWEIETDACRWIYRHAGGTIEVRSRAGSVADRTAHELGLSLRVLAGGPARFLVCHHVALDGDDGCAGGAIRIAAQEGAVVVRPPEASELARRFPGGGFRIAAEPGTAFERVGGDELLFADGKSRGEPFACLVTAAATSVELRITGELVAGGPDMPARGTPAGTLPLPRFAAPAASALAADISRLEQILPWYAHDALVHYLAPRGLEQFSGGGWGTRDVCQGPVDLLLALDRPAPVRGLLLRTFAAQNPDGDWPQWFAFFARDRHVRARDSHGDIAFWPLLALAQYLVATGDSSLLDERLPFFRARGRARGEHASVLGHAQRALALIERRTIPGTRLAAYGHGDWNDALQPADPLLRERMCSAWTVTLHAQVLDALATAMRFLGREADARGFEAQARAVRDDFTRLLVVDGTVAGYALFAPGGEVDYLLHPRDRRTGVTLSLLPMVHAVLADMLPPEAAREHLARVARSLAGPDGARLFDRPLAYRGGPQRIFLRAESSAYFGREIGLMYTHAHLRYAEALARVGDAEAFFDALCRANPIALRLRVPTARLRQSNCYYSSSDAAFRDRYEASDGYDRILRGEVGLEGGWRIYSSGPGIGVSLVVRGLFGIRRERARLVVDPVLPVALDGLRARIEIGGRPVDVTYRVGKRGFGPTDLVLNGDSLGFERGANPYRTGAAELPMAAFVGRLGDGDNTLTVRVG